MEMLMQQEPPRPLTVWLEHSNSTSTDSRWKAILAVSQLLQECQRLSGPSRCLYHLHTQILENLFSMLEEPTPSWSLSGVFTVSMTKPHPPLENHGADSGP